MKRIFHCAYAVQPTYFGGILIGTTKFETEKPITEARLNGLRDVIAIKTNFPASHVVVLSLIPLEVGPEPEIGENHCHDCGACPEQTHIDGCDVERCTVCGGQRRQCDCPGHDKLAARWTGEWPADTSTPAPPQTGGIT